MLNDGMQERVLRRNAHLACINFHVLDILLVNFIAIFGQHYASTVIKTLQVRPGDRDVNAADHHIALLFGIDHSFVHAFHRGFKINNFPLADTARWRLAYPKNFESPIGAAFPDDHADFGGANLKTDHQIIARHRC